MHLPAHVHAPYTHVHTPYTHVYTYVHTQHSHKRTFTCTLAILYCSTYFETGVCIIHHTMLLPAPIPGGCSTVSPLEYDPNIYLTFDPYTTTWSFSDANLGFNASNSSLLLICDDAKYGYVPVKSLEYYTYIFYLPERSYSVDHMFDGIENMLSSQGVSSYGDKV